jgi:hypothetical protein
MEVGCHRMAVTDVHRVGGGGCDTRCWGFGTQRKQRKDRGHLSRVVFADYSLCHGGSQQARAWTIGERVRSMPMPGNGTGRHGIQAPGPHAPDLSWSPAELRVSSRLGSGRSGNRGSQGGRFVTAHSPSTTVYLSAVVAASAGPAAQFQCVSHAARNSPRHLLLTPDLPSVFPLFPLC